jgi:MFS family permease
MAETGAQVAAVPDWQRRFPALMYPNFRLWFIAQVIASFGMWMQITAQGYLVYELTRSPVYLGYVSFVSGIPTWLFTLYGGVVADRIPRRTLMLITQSCMMVLALVLAALTLLGLIQPWHILVLAFLLGIANAFDAPARQSFILEFVERRDLANAVALSSTMFNLATMLGPAAAGFTYALVGPGWCFLLNGFSFTGVISILFMLKLKPMPLATSRVSVASQLKEGLRFVAHEPTVRVLMFLVAAMSMFGMSFVTLFPAWAVNVLGGDATTNGLLQSARGAGAFASALWIASLGRFSYKGKVLTVGALLVPFTIIAFSQVTWLPLSLLLLVATGLVVMPVFNLANALVQTLTPDHLRGRVMSIYTLIFFGLWPVGGMWVGALAQRIGEPPTVLLGGVIVLVIVVGVFLRFPMLRNVE